MNITAQEFQLFKEYLYAKSGIEIGEEKVYLFTTRLHDLIITEGCRSFTELYQKLNSNKFPALSRTVVELMMTHESGFFRDDHPFKFFLGQLLPEIASRKTSKTCFLPQRLRILSAGCCFGQEPYSLAIGIRRWIGKQSNLKLENVTIIGIDISGKAIDLARKGLYSEMELGKTLGADNRRAWFTNKDDKWQLSDDIRNMVSFEQRSLMEPLATMGTFDVIFCRNVIIYFSMEMKKRVLKNIRDALDPSGALFLGVAENMYSLSDDFSSCTDNNTTWYKIRNERQSKNPQ